MADLFENPLGTDGFEFLEYAGDSAVLDKLFTQFGFAAVAKHKAKDLVLYRQGKVNFILNREKSGQGAAFAKEHNGGVNAMGFRVRDAKKAYDDAIKRGAKPAANGPFAFDFPALQTLGGAIIYLVDDADFYDAQ